MGQLNRKRVWIFSIHYVTDKNWQRTYTANILAHDIESAEATLYARVGKYTLLESADVGIAHLCSDEVAKQISENWNQTTKSTFTDKLNQPVVL